MSDDLLVIVPCGSAKIWKKHPNRGPTPARDAYTGSPFQVNREFAETHADRWVILSAKYGFVAPDFLIPEAYEVTFKRRSTNPIAYERLAEQVREMGLHRHARIIGLGGKDYRAAIRAAFDGLDAPLEFPTAGMKLGESLGFLKSYEPWGEGDTGPERDRRVDLNRFYGIVDILRERLGGALCLADCDGRMDWPEQGVYFFFEPGETREDGVTPRVVRVGTHAVSAGSRTTLWNRLRQHRGTLTGAYAGGGNHRGSIFRHHVGTALLNAGDYPVALHETWPTRGTAPAEVREAELPLERAVSEDIRAMPFLWLRAEDVASADSIRGMIEQGAVALLSNADKRPIDPPSAGWLGHHCAHEAVRESGLWNVNYVYDDYAPGFLNDFERLVGEM